MSEEINNSIEHIAKCEMYDVIEVNFLKKKFDDLQQKVEQQENKINNIIKKCKDKQYETNDEWLKKFAKEIQNNLESKGE